MKGGSVVIKMGLNHKHKASFLDFTFYVFGKITHHLLALICSSLSGKKKKKIVPTSKKLVGLRESGYYLT